MKTTASVYDFRDAFERSDRKDNFSYRGLGALFDHLDQYEEDTGEEIELDVIALCCDFTEYENLAELKTNYTDIESMTDLEDSTIVIYVDDPPNNTTEELENYDGKFIIQDF